MPRLKLACCLLAATCAAQQSGALRHRDDHHDDAEGTLRRASSIARSLANNMVAAGKVREAEELQTVTETAQVALHFESDKRTLVAMRALGIALYEHGKYEEAVATLRKALAAMREVLGDNHSEITLTETTLIEAMIARMKLAIPLSKQAKHEEAEAMLVEALDAMRKVLGDHHPHMLKAMQRLASFLGDQGRQATAVALYTYVLAASRQVLGNLHESTKHNRRSTIDKGSIDEAQLNLAKSLRLFGKHDEAHAMEIMAVLTQLRGGGGTEMVRELEDADELEALHQEANEAAQLLVLDFTATWCGPCQRIAPVVHDLAEEYSGQAIFAKIDVDIMGDVAAELGVTSMPTFLFFRNGELVDTMRGADETGLRERVAEHTN